MRKSLVAGAVVALAGAGAAAPYFTGMQAEQAFEENLRSVSEHPQVELQKVRYQRHWFSAEARTKLTLDSADEQVTVQLRHRISHGPTPTNPSLARITTTPVIEGEAKKLVERFFGDQSPITADLTLGLTGTQHLTLSSPSFQGSPADSPNTRIEWAGLSGQGEFHDHSGSLQLDAPGLKVSDNEGRMRMEGLELRSDFRRQAEELWLGDSDMSAEHFEMHFPDSDTGGTHHFKLAELRFQQRTEQSDDGKFLAVASEVSAAAAAADGKELKNPSLSLELRHIDTEAYQAITKRFRQLDSEGLSEEEMSQKGLAILQETVPQLLAGSPEVALTDLSFQTPAGKFRGNAKARYQGEGDQARMALTNPALLLQGLEAEAQIEAGKPLVIGVLEEKTRQKLKEQVGADMDPVRMEKMVERAVRQRLGMMEAMGFLESEEDRYVSKVAWNRGTVSVNGQPLNLGAAMGKGGPAMP